MHFLSKIGKEKQWIRGKEKKRKKEKSKRGKGVGTQEEYMHFLSKCPARCNLRPVVKVKETF